MDTAFPQPIRLLGTPFCNGARVDGCQFGPETLRVGGLEALLREQGADVAWDDALPPLAAAQDDPYAMVHAACAGLAQRSEALLRRGIFPLALGGDHSLAVGLWSGVTAARPEQEPPGLLWIDAHLDSHTPQTSVSHAIHGMPLATLLGHGHPLLTGLAPRPLDPARVCVVGAHSFEPAEAALLLQLGVRVFPMAEIRSRGLDAVMAEALEIVTRGSGEFGVSIDVDALDPRDAPGTGTPEPGGLGAGELGRALAGIARDPRCLALEIAEYNPLLDRDGITLGSVKKLIAACFAAEGLDAQALIALENQHGAHNYAPLPVVVTRGSGIHLWDVDGQRYIDMLGAYSAASLGHAHPRLTAALERQAKRLSLTSRAFHNDRLPQLLQRLTALSGLDSALPVNTGLEAVETALKAARKWAYQVKGVAEGQARIIACERNFHGRSIAIVGFSSEPQYREGFGPFPAGFTLIPFGDAAALEAAITPDTAAFLVEPIQGEGGINVPPQGYLARVREICTRHNVLLILDEVQTGLGRTGKLFAFQHEDILPDGLILGKALGGGLLPVSAFLAKRAVMQVFRPGDHGSTFGGNPLAAAVALEALDILESEKLAERAEELGAYFRRNLSELRSPLIREIRGKGLLIGMEIDTNVASAEQVCVSLARHGILSKDAHQTVIRFAPPLIISRAQIDEAMSAIAAALHALETPHRKAG